MRTHLIEVIVDKLLASDWDTGPAEPEPTNPVPPGNASVRFAPRRGGGGGSSRWPFLWGRTGNGAVPEAVEEDADCSDSVRPLRFSSLRGAADARCGLQECYGWEYGDFFNSSRIG